MSKLLEGDLRCLHNGQVISAFEEKYVSGRLEFWSNLVHDVTLFWSHIIFQRDLSEVVYTMSKHRILKS